MMREDFEWFVANYDALHDQYGDCFLVIKDKKVLRACQSYAEGVHETEKEEPLGTFIVQECRGATPSYNSCIASTCFTQPVIR